MEWRYIHSLLGKGSIIYGLHAYTNSVSKRGGKHICEIIKITKKKKQAHTLNFPATKFQTCSAIYTILS